MSLPGVAVLRQPQNRQTEGACKLNTVTREKHTADGRLGDHPAFMPLSVSSTTLLVADIDTMTAWYQAVLGFVIIHSSEFEVVLGTDSCALLTLRVLPEARHAPRGASGLFHTAYVVPTRADLAEWFSHAARLGTQITGASDHGVSEAIYLDDPEGNGVEVYVDKPRKTWPTQAGGHLSFPTRRLDLKALVKDVDVGRSFWVATDTRIGHLHL